ncbi:MAG: DUF2382 domain-containing protein [Leptolyngbyaceae cyanobacterium RM2_2_21]|nr:DUF2382 domain-containing protein [Leptolyngbyaceae cyanobacterium RM2_2_21]
MQGCYPNSRETFGNNNEIAHFDEYSVYTRGDEKVGSVSDTLFEDATSNIRYLIVDTGFWVFGKKVLLPIGLAHFDYDQKRVYVDGLTREQVEGLPEYTDDMTIDNDYEERVRSGYRTLGDNRSRQFMGQEYDADEYNAYPGSAALYGATEPAVGTSAAVTGTTGMATDTDADLYDYDREPGMYAMDRDAHQPIRLYQERLIADKDRFKSGEVAIGKRVKSETKEVSVPVEKERIVIERTTPTDTKATANMPDFHEGEVARMETYAEEADIHKEAFVREEVNIRKEVDRDTVSGRETIRREELDIDTEGNPNVTGR